MPLYKKAVVFTILFSSVCGLLYELVISTASSYLLGNTVFNFSVTIGLFLFAMGIGSFLSQFIKRNLYFYFVLIEIGISILGGISVLALYATFATVDNAYIVMSVFILAIGTLIGFEIPLATQISLTNKSSVKHNLASILSFDYVGALLASLAFPLLLLPFIGVVQTAILAGLLNAGVALFLASIDSPLEKQKRLLQALAVAAIVVLAGASATTTYSLGQINKKLYQDEIIYSHQSPYQQIVMTQWNNDLRLFIDGNLQFSSVDEARYHEALAHPVFTSGVKIESVLVLGGGDGLATRELLKYEEIKTITVVDLDPAITELAKNNSLLQDLNQKALSNPKVTIVNQDAFKFLEHNSEKYDVIIADLPDPNNESLAKLYTQEFYILTLQALSETGIFVTQATSPYFTPRSFNSITKTLESIELVVYPYHIYVPSFGDWGFVIASRYPLEFNQPLKVETTYLEDQLISTLFEFGKRTQEAEVSTLDQPRIIDLYLADWDQWR